ncbi:uncharacterized protein LOC129590191 [Paramacrobiotus metropolitanus]|uniref:uncharacterized protein LOC129590191 n=1 Tax=Paramacrobiotus metropolitanus TaxID=2943436 RepID=UPI00244650FB|nr:uncharacterized protein LOC129590191 [Paramacrobiotus metropolitanus]
MEPVPVGADDPTDAPPASAGGSWAAAWGTSTGVDDYVLFFLGCFTAYHVSTSLLGGPRIAEAVQALNRAPFGVRFGFFFICSLVVLGWVAILETVIQMLVPAYFISSWGLAISGAFTLLSVGALRLLVRNTVITLKIAAALLFIVLPVEAIHFYLINNFRKCIPLPVLYVVTPIAMMHFVKNYLDNFGRQDKKENKRMVTNEPCGCGESGDGSRCDEDERCHIDDGSWARDFEAYRSLGRSEQQRLENLALKIDPDFARYSWDPRSAMFYQRPQQKTSHRR